MCYHSIFSPRWSTKRIALTLSVKTSSSKNDALKVDEFQIAWSIMCYSAIRFVDHLGESMVTHGKGRNFMVFNNLAFFNPVGFF